MEGVSHGGGLQPSLPPAATIFQFSVLEAIWQCPRLMQLTQAATSGPKDEADTEVPKCTVSNVLTQVRMCLL